MIWRSYFVQCVLACISPVAVNPLEQTLLANLITSDNRGVAAVCTGLASLGYLGRFLSLPCRVLHRIAFAVVSEWSQRRHSSFTILLTRARIRSTPSTSLTTPPYSLPSTATRTGCPLWAATPQTEWIRHWAKCSLLAHEYHARRNRLPRVIL
jgi:hypothetical protein